MAEARIVLHGDRYFRDGEAFSIVPYSEPVKAGMRPHTHDFVEICYVDAGEGYHVVEGRPFKVAGGDLFLINYEMEHAFYREEGAPELRTYNILFKPGFLDESLLPFHDFTSLTLSYLFQGAVPIPDYGMQPDKERIGPDLRLNPSEQRECSRLVRRMHREYTGRQSGSSAVIRAYMIELIVLMLRSFNRQGAADESLPRRAAGIDQAIRYLEQHYHEPISLVELARRSFLSKNYFCQLFKEATGMTVSQYTQQMRMEEAIRLMRDTDKTMAEIAREVGYTDYKTFYTAFRQAQQLSPHAYRKLELED